MISALSQAFILQKFRISKNWQDFQLSLVNDINNGFFKSTQLFSIFDQLATKYKSLQIQKKSIGKSFEGREIQMYKFSVSQTKKNILVTAGLHADQRFTNNLIISLIFRALYRFQRNQSIFNYFNLLIVPLVNIDAALYNQNLNQFQFQKNRRKTGCHQSLSGTDLDRNFDYQFGTQRQSGVLCGNYYRGGSAFSQSQTESLKNLVQGEQIVFHLNLGVKQNRYIIPSCSFQQNHQNYTQFFQNFVRLSPLESKTVEQAEGISKDGRMLDWMLDRNGVPSVQLEGRQRQSLSPGDFQQLIPAIDHFLNYSLDQNRDQISIAQELDFFLIEFTKLSSFVNSSIRVSEFGGDMMVSVDLQRRLDLFRNYNRGQVLTLNFLKTIKFKLYTTSSQHIVVQSENWKIPIQLIKTKHKISKYTIVLLVLALFLIPPSCYCIYLKCQKRDSQKKGKRMQPHCQLAEVQ